MNFEILIDLVKKHGVRAVVNSLAVVIDEAAEAGENLPYDTEVSDEQIDPNDLRTVAENLRADLY